MRNIIITEEQYKSLMKENEIPIESFYRKHGIDPEDLWEMGSGQMGTAYQTEDGKVLKITTSPSEFAFAQHLLKYPNKFSNLVTIYDAADTKEGYVILQELLDTDPVENIYGTAESIIQSQGHPVAYADYFDEEEYEENYGELEEDLKDFIDQLGHVAFDYRRIGAQAPDIKDDNLGFADDGTLKAFDLDDRAQLQ